MKCRVNKSCRWIILALLTFLLVTVSPIRAALSPHDALAQESEQNFPFPLPLFPFPVPKSLAQASLLEQGKRLYERGHLQEAVQMWIGATEKLAGRDRLAAYRYLAIAYQNLGQWEAAQAALAQAQALLPTVDDDFLTAQVLSTQGSLEYRLGRSQAALVTWQQAAELYRALDAREPLLRTQVNQAQALRSLGFYRRASTVLEQANQELEELPDSILKAKALQSLGVTRRGMGELEQAQRTLQHSLAIAQRLESLVVTEAVQLSLANTLKALGNSSAALAIYQQLEQSADVFTQVEASVHRLSLLAQTDAAAALKMLPTLRSRLQALPNARRTVQARINLAASLANMNAQEQAAELLTVAIASAKEFNDSRAESTAVGQLGHLYEQTQQWSVALKLTQQALTLAHQSRSSELAALWHWQQGRIFTEQGQTGEAIAAYAQAFTEIQVLRQDLAAINPDEQFSFREQVEPIYRQYVGLLLQNVDSLPTNQQQEHLRRSREVIEALQLAELENFFREACLTDTPQTIDDLDPHAAVIYPILLEERLEVILSRPGQPLRHYGISVSPTETAKIFQALSQALHPSFAAKDVLPPAQQLYDWLIRPGEAFLTNTDTLVFILDGFLRNLPMAVLHDGERYLVEKYSIALTPGLRLLESGEFELEQLNVLTGGLTAARQGFASLPSVGEEIQRITDLVDAQVLLNQDFTRANFHNQIQGQPAVVHLATHGQFSSEAEETFLLTWQDRIYVQDLDQVLQQGALTPVELLVLSACETAAGDERAALGMAGVAVRSGARSTVASLWTVSDRSTAIFMSQFYRLLANHAPKAQALRQAQLSLMQDPQYRHPYYWSPFVLVGNWR
ncbi:MAG: CHAT domain-containing protein [Cyanophyceae cyanobacterium]